MREFISVFINIVALAIFGVAFKRFRKDFLVLQGRRQTGIRLLCAATVLAGIAILPFIWITTDTVNNTYFIIVGALYLYLLTGLSSYIYHKNQRKWLGRVVLLCIILEAVLLWNGILYTLFAEEMNRILLAVGILLSAVLPVTAYLLESMTQKQSESENRLIELNNFYKAQLDSMQEAYNSVREVKHNISNDLKTISLLMNQEEYDKVRSYLEKSMSKAGFSAKTIDCGNSIIDGILNYKVQQARKQGIEISCNIEVPADIPIDEFDLGNIIGNLLDNAVRASVKADKKVDVKIIYRMGIITFDVKNRFIGKVTVGRNNEVYTTQPEERGHGYGLKSVKHIVDTYGGTFTLTVENNVFRAFVSMLVDA